MNDENSNLIRLRAREFVPKAGLGRGLSQYVDRLRENKRLHILIQFDHAISPEERRSLAGKFKINLLDPVPELGFFAAVPANLDVVKAVVGRGKQARWAGPIEPTDKVAPWLASGEVPPHARTDSGTLLLVVQFFGDVPLASQSRVLDRYRAVSLAQIEPINGWLVELDEGFLMDLASEDPVKWIEEAPPPSELDNDSVRSTTGTNTDAVLPPSFYNATGAGVIVGHWENTHASLTHADFAGRITLADPPVAVDERNWTHSESVAANGQFDNGEPIYVDMDDSGTVSVGDVRVTAAAGFPASSVVAVGDTDIGTPLILFLANEMFADTVTSDWLYTPGEPIYRDNDGNGAVNVGDVRITPPGGFAAGSVVAAGDSDIGQILVSFITLPHYHSTHVAGTVIGSGAQSASQGGGANQWKGVASGASLRSYVNEFPLLPDYTNAASNGVSISTNSWGTSHMHQVLPPNTGYESTTQFYDAVISGRKSDGTPSGLSGTILIFGSAGNSGRPERHAENVAANGQFDNGESIYLDNDDNGTVSGEDNLVSGPALPIGTTLVNFAANEMHEETAGVGLYQPGEGIYRDLDGSRTVTPGDVRINGIPGFPAGSVVAAGDADIGRNLKPFRFWETVRIPNSAKNTIVVANIRSDTKVPSSSTSRGPTLDGRVKPDLAGPGSQGGGDFGVTSTWPGNSYAALIGGTSMSTPAVAGVAALLTERYRAACAAAGPPPHTIRALLIHSAEDLPVIPNIGAGFIGPDFTFGYGRVRAKEALDLIPHHRQGTASVLGDTDIAVTIGSMSGLKVTLAWDDPPWTANTPPSSVTGMLQNDLDLLLIAPDGTQYTPWVLNPANPGAPATRSILGAGTPVPAVARDRRNTVEQVVVDNAAAGTWTIRVTASKLNLAPQPYTIVSEVLPPQGGPCASSPAADVWMRDNSSDGGAVPSSGTMYLSPDIWNRLLADGGISHDPPEFGQQNYLYANIRNASAVAVHSTSIDIWIAAASTGISWPVNFTFVGRIAVPNLSPSETRQVGPLPWNPPDPTPSSHFCMYMRVQSPQDPITFVETDNLWINAQNSNNIVWRNIDVVNLMSTRKVSFLVRNVSLKSATVVLLVKVDERFLEVGETLVGLSPELQTRQESHESSKDTDIVSPVSRPPVPVRLSQRARQVVALREPEERRPTPVELKKPLVRLPGFELDPGQAEPVTLTFRSDQRGDVSYEVEVIQEVDGEQVGGILYIIKTQKHLEDDTQPT